MTPTEIRDQIAFNIPDNLQQLITPLRVREVLLSMLEFSESVAYTPNDTLDSVSDRGAVTNQALTVGGIKTQTGSYFTELKPAAHLSNNVEVFMPANDGTLLTSSSPINASQITSGVLDPARIPVMASGVQVVSSGAIADLTTPQQAQITAGAIVTTTDGRRWVYKGSGSKTAEASYIEMADVTPDWSVIANKPAFGTVSLLSTNGNGSQYLAGDGTWKTVVSGGTWGSITGTLGDQTDLITELNGKVALTGNQTIAGVKTFGGQVLVTRSLTGSDATSALLVAGAWNTTGAPTAFNISITNTASDVASKLFAMAVDGNNHLSYTISSALMNFGYGSTLVGVGSVNSANGSGSASGKAMQVLSNVGSDTGYGVWMLSIVNQTNASGTAGLINAAQSFAPTSGTGVYNMARFAPTIDQGASTGISRAILIEPTLTVAADFRALEITNNTGRGLWVSGTAANAIAGTLSIGAAASVTTSSVLEISSTTAGVLIPRMTTTQRNAITSPATGLLIYNTTTGALNHYNGTNWKQYIAPSSSDAVSFSSTLAVTNSTATVTRFQISTTSQNAYLYMANSSNAARVQLHTSGESYLAGGKLTIGATAGTSASAAFEVVSTTQGVLLANMTTTQRDAIGTPATGLLVWNSTTGVLNQYNGTNWQPIVTPDSSGNVVLPGSLKSSAPSGSAAGAWKFGVYQTAFSVSLVTNRYIRVNIDGNDYLLGVVN